MNLSYIDDFTKSVLSEHKLKEQNLNNRLRESLIRESMVGDYNPYSYKISEAYRQLAPHVNDEDWSTLRETIIELERMEKDFNSPSFYLREHRSNLLQEYIRTALFDNTEHLQERGLADLSDEDRALYDKYKDRKDLFRNKDSYGQRIAKLKKHDANQSREDQLDQERELAQANEDVADIENDKEAEKTIQDAFEDVEQLGVNPSAETELAKDFQQLEFDFGEDELNLEPPAEKNKLKKGLTDLVNKLKGKGKVGLDFIKNHIPPKLLKVAGTIATVAGGIFGGLKFLPIFAPLGPIAPVVSIAVGVASAFLVKKVGKEAGKLGGDKFAPMLTKFFANQAEKARNKFTKKIFTALSGPKGAAATKIICQISFAVIAGAATTGAIAGVVKTLGPALVNHLTAAGITQADATGALEAAQQAGNANSPEDLYISRGMQSNNLGPDQNGLLPKDYDANGWAMKGGKWVHSDNPVYNDANYRAQLAAGNGYPKPQIPVKPNVQGIAQEIGPEINSGAIQPEEAIEMIASETGAAPAEAIQALENTGVEVPPEVATQVGAPPVEPTPAAAPPVTPTASPAAPAAPIAPNAPAAPAAAPVIGQPTAVPASNVPEGYNATQTLNNINSFNNTIDHLAASPKALQSFISNKPQLLEVINEAKSYPKYAGMNDASIMKGIIDGSVRTPSMYGVNKGVRSMLNTSLSTIANKGI